MINLITNVNYLEVAGDLLLEAFDKIFLEKFLISLSNLLPLIACTRTSEELLGARKSYHSLFDRSLEEDIVSLVDGVERKLLLALVSTYRYEGSKVKDDTAKSEAQALSAAIKFAHEKPILEDEEVIRMLATRSKPHLQDLDDLRLKEEQCLSFPCNILYSASGCSIET